MTGDKLIFLAGNRALETIRTQGLAPDDVKVVAGAAGGPKWLILGHLDRVLFGNWFRGRGKPLFLLGSSIGSWRFAADSCMDPVAAIDRMEDAYIHQTYDRKPTPREISEKSLAIIDHALGAAGPVEVLSHPVHRLSLVAVRSRHLLASRHRLPIALGLAAAVTANTLTRRSLRWFFQQTLFSDPRTHPSFSAAGRWPGAGSALSPDNLKQALLASGSIPYVMDGVGEIPDAPPGIYRDGGAVDYHLDIPFGLNGSGIVLYPHFSRRIIPGWLDKYLSWRRPSSAHMADVLVVAPSESFVSSLPNEKITDRKDFYRYAGNDKARFACWHQVANAGKRLADDFMEAVESGSIRRRVKPLDGNAR
ncbi:MAG: patatin-like phospholipase family protein [Desulfosarcina sp.]|nr:patatin-like phospholipase family protein [Desulfosarcina sp.]MBC2741906.1 patatin-like phospholipase family protein [Desulfosarcina sp.]MBC2764819.1 patatin-like phospholipase family protein [Desulfosarcina sp.]